MHFNRIAFLLLLFPIGGLVRSEEPPSPEATVDQAEIERLVKALGDADFAKREAAEQKLKQIGKSALPQLRRGVGSPDLEIATRCRRIFEILRVRGEGDRQVHMIGLYEATNGMANVEVDVPDKPVILVLCAYESVKWKVKVSPKTNVVAVIASGYHQQFVTGIDAPIYRSSYDQRSDGYFFCYKETGQRYQKAQEAVFAATNLYPRSFQGRYSSENTPFVIKASQSRRN